MIIPAIVAGAAVSAVSVVGLTTLATDQPDPQAGLRVPCGAVWERLPAELRADLADMRDLPDAEKPAALRAIREDAAAGEYGRRVAQATDRIQHRRAELLERLPEGLRADLDALRALPDGQKVDAAKEMRADALAGTYGEQVQGFAERMQERRETCSR